MRTFVLVELEHAEADQSFATAMRGLGFTRTVTGKPSRRSLRLPGNTYLIERTGAVEALELAREAARKSQVRARIFCVPAQGDLRFGGLQPV